MNPMKNQSRAKLSAVYFRTAILNTRTLLVCLGLSFMLCGIPAGAQSQGRPDGSRATAALGGAQSPDQPVPGTITGTVVDPSGAIIAGARVSLTRDGQSSTQEALSGNDGQFSFANVQPGPFHFTISAPGFAPQTSAGTLSPGQLDVLPPVTMPLAAEVTEMQVVPSQTEIAEDQIKDQEKQRVLDVIPNFYVSYVPNAVPLSSKQKFELAWKTTVDPVTIGITGAIAGLQQAQNHFSGYGQGAQGYGKRFGASYADMVTATFIGGAILPSILKQDPRYFYKGTGSVGSRILYAIANSVICKGDNKRWQPNYSSVLGNLTSGGISNLYYPAEDRDGATLTIENALIGIGASAAANLLQEFVIRKLTPNLPKSEPAKS